VARWLRTLQAQLMLWAVLPLTFVIIALAFTGVYAHQRAMRDFVIARNLDVARLIARVIENGLALGTIDTEGQEIQPWLQPLMAEQDSAIAVLDGSGHVLARSEAIQAEQDLSSTPYGADILSRFPGSPNGGAFTIPGTGQDALLVAFAPVQGSDWTVMVEEPVTEVIGPVLRLSSLAPAVAAGAGIVSLLVLASGWRTIVRPLRQLSQAAGQVSWGDFSAITRPVGGVQEIRDLHSALTEMAERVSSYEGSIRDYLQAMTSGQEAERARLAREIHDGPVQELIALGQRAEMAQRMLTRGQDEQASAVLEELRQAEYATVAELRRMIGALRPAYLEDLGFLPALEVLVKQAAKQDESDIHLETSGQVVRLAPETELAAYRIAQEALSNAVQHARALLLQRSMRRRDTSA